MENKPFLVVLSTTNATGEAYYGKELALMRLRQLMDEAESKGMTSVELNYEFYDDREE